MSTIASDPDLPPKTWNKKKKKSLKLEIKDEIEATFREWREKELLTHDSDWERNGEGDQWAEIRENFWERKRWGLSGLINALENERLSIRRVTRWGCSHSLPPFFNGISFIYVPIFIYLKSFLI